jgi:Icc-related predicted phosphoesterase
MKIFCISDLHLEFYANWQELFSQIKKKLPKADVLVLAGDIGYTMNIKDTDNFKDNYEQLVREFKNMYDHVVIVSGNHEYYQAHALGYDFSHIDKNITDIAKKYKCNYLNKSTVVIQGVQFIGLTLWSRLQKKMEIIQRTNDIKKCFYNIDQYNQEFEDSFKWLRNQLIDNPKNESLPTVVITHHLPSNKLCHEKFKDNPMNSLFYTNILDELNLQNVRYWFCGHTHEANKIIHKNEDSATTVIVNPFGYPKEQDTRDTDMFWESFEI